MTIAILRSPLFDFAVGPEHTGSEARGRSDALKTPSTRSISLTKSIAVDFGYECRSKGFARNSLQGNVAYMTEDFQAEILSLHHKDLQANGTASTRAASNMTRAEQHAVEAKNERPIFLQMKVRKVCRPRTKQVAAEWSAFADNLLIGLSESLHTCWPQLGAPFASDTTQMNLWRMTHKAGEICVTRISAQP